MWSSEGLDFALAGMATDSGTEHQPLYPRAKVERLEKTPAVILQREPMGGGACAKGCSRTHPHSHSVKEWL